MSPTATPPKEATTVTERQAPDPPPAGSPGNVDADVSEPASLVRHEEELDVATVPVEVGAVRARKRVEQRHVAEVVPRSRERFIDVERARPDEQDSGEIEVLPDGSVSVPIVEEELVVTKRTVVRERLIVRKEATTDQQRIQTELRQERVEVETDDAAQVRGDSS